MIGFTFKHMFNVFPKCKIGMYNLGVARLEFICNDLKQVLCLETAEKKMFCALHTIFQNMFSKSWQYFYLNVTVCYFHLRNLYWQLSSDNLALSIHYSYKSSVTAEYEINKRHFSDKILNLKRNNETTALTLTVAHQRKMRHKTFHSDNIVTLKKIK